MHWRAWLAPALLALVSGLAGAPQALAAEPVLVVDGQGFGHGVGMAQDGAYWMGRSGSTTPQILGRFYPGTAIGRATGQVRVEVLSDDDGDVTVTFPDGGEVRSPLEGNQAAGFPIPVARGGAMRIRHDAVYRVTPAGAVQARSTGRAQLLPLPTTPPNTTLPHAPDQPGGPPPSPPPTPAPSTSTTTSPSAERTSASSVWAVPAANGTVGVPDRQARYRGVIEATAAAGPLRLVDALDVEQYLRGMGEVQNPSWPAASLRSQAIVARTYAIRAMRANGEICDTQRCQVYLGQQAEYAAMDRAVHDTAGQVLTFRGGIAAAVYSANGAGVSATPSEGFGTPDGPYPYLRASAYETHTPDVWQVRVSLADLAPRLHYAGALNAVTVASVGPSNRPTAVTLDGSAGHTSVPAIAVVNALSLRSTKWTAHVEVADAPPPPPPPADAAAAIQALPDDAITPSIAAASRARAAVAGQPARSARGRHVPVGATLGVVALAGAGAVLVVARRRRPTDTDDD